MLLAATPAPSLAPHADFVLSPAGQPPSWHAVWTRSHCEQLVHDLLAAGGLAAFLPKASVWSRRGGLRRPLDVPLFPGYVFVRMPVDKAAYIEVLRTRGVVRILGERWDRPALIPDEEIEAIQQVMAAGAPILPHMHLREGSRVRITGGPLAGLEGRFVSGRADRGLLVLSIDLLQRSVAVEVDCTLVAAA